MHLQRCLQAVDDPSQSFGSDKSQSKDPQTDSTGFIPALCKQHKSHDRESDQTRQFRKV